MALDTDTILDRRRLRRRLSFWRSAGIAALALLVGSMILGSDGLSELGGADQIARVAIEGPITDDREQVALLNRLAEANHVKGVILFVNSPGGTTTGGESLFDALRKVSEKKPIVAQFGTVAASAGYIVGLATDHIVARGNTITGSVGVLVQWPEVDQLMAKLGVKMQTLKSGEFKATPNPFEPLDDRSRQQTQEMIAESYRWFVSLVEDRRKIKVTDVPGLETGRIYSGREALQYNLIDEIGGESEAKTWLEGKGLSAKLKVIDWKPSQPGQGWFLSSAMHSIAQTMFGDSGRAISEALLSNGSIATRGLDGLLSVWQPSEK